MRCYLLYCLLISDFLHFMSKASTLKSLARFFFPNPLLLFCPFLSSVLLWHESWLLPCGSLPGMEWRWNECSNLRKVRCWIVWLHSNTFSDKKIPDALWRGRRRFYIVRGHWPLFSLEGWCGSSSIWCIVKSGKVSMGVTAKFCCLFSSMFVLQLIREEMKVKPFVALIRVHQDLEVAWNFTVCLCRWSEFEEAHYWVWATADAGVLGMQKPIL